MGWQQMRQNTTPWRDNHTAGQKKQRPADTRQNYGADIYINPC